MGHVILIFGTLIAINFGIGYEVSDKLYEDSEGVIEIQEIASVEPVADQNRTLTNWNIGNDYELTQWHQKGSITILTRTLLAPFLS